MNMGKFQGQNANTTKFMDQNANMKKEDGISTIGEPFMCVGRNLYEDLNPKKKT